MLEVNNIFCTLRPDKQDSIQFILTASNYSNLPVYHYLLNGGGAITAVQHFCQTFFG
jgi:hypothetical protein